MLHPLDEEWYLILKTWRMQTLCDRVDFYIYQGWVLTSQTSITGRIYLYGKRPKKRHLRLVS